MSVKHRLRTTTKTLCYLEHLSSAVESGHVFEVVTGRQFRLKLTVSMEVINTYVPPNLMLLQMAVFPIWHFAGNDKCGGSKQVAVEQVRIPCVRNERRENKGSCQLGGYRY